MKKRLSVDIDVRHPMAITACFLMLAAAVVRLIYFVPSDMSPFVFVVHLMLPVAAAVLFITGTFLGGKPFRWLCTLAVLCGVVFFVLKAFTFSLVHQILCTVLYAAVLSIYSVTVHGFLPTTKLLLPLFGLPFLYHVFVEDTQYYVFADPPVPFREWLPEISVLLIMAALFFQSLAMKSESSEGEKSRKTTVGN